MNKNDLQQLEADREYWFAYFLPMLYHANPADFQRESTLRVIGNPHWFEMRLWSRLLAGTTRAMMEVLYLMLTGKKQFCILVSDTASNAEYIKRGYDLQLTKNNRLLEAYGERAQKVLESLHAGGEGQSLTGIRLGDKRPDLMVIDGVDTAENCTHVALLERRFQWYTSHLFCAGPLDNLSIIWNNPVLSPDCVSLRMLKHADHYSLVNMLDDNGDSNWPSWINAAQAAELFSTMSGDRVKREFYNSQLKPESLKPWVAS